MGPIIFIIVLFAIFYYFYKGVDDYKSVRDNRHFKPEWRNILNDSVKFYRTLGPDLREQFEIKLMEFLINYRIVGIRTKVTQSDKLLVACSAVIPTFQIRNWRYTYLEEVFLYPDSFTIPGTNKKATGLVGSGSMEGKMLLSLKALRAGFLGSSDNKNVGIHEFIHLIDKEDGEIDGIPDQLLNHSYVIPWMKLVKRKIEEIDQEGSDIRKYGASDVTEFFTVVSEYFFENPEKMKEKHSKLYETLTHVFKQDPARRIKKFNLTKRRDLCPCNSGKTFRTCCGKEHFRFIGRKRTV